MRNLLRGHDKMLTYAIRGLRRSPTFTIVAILSLALALALNTTVFAVADAIMHPVNPYPDAGRLYTARLWGGDKVRQVKPGAQERAIRDAVDGADGADAITVSRFRTTMVSSGTMSSDQVVSIAAPNLFDVLGVRPMLGRTFSTAPDAENAAIISYRLWNRFYAGRPLGPATTITVGDHEFPVIGVMPRGVHFLIQSDVWVPMSAFSGDSTVMNQPPFITFHLKANVNAQAIRAAVDVAAKRLAAQYGQNIPYNVTFFGGALGGGSGVPRELSGVMTITGIVLLIACANLGTMMLARGMARRREIAIRIAIGASRGAIVAEVLTECALVVAAGIAVGLVLMMWAIHIVPHVVSPFVGSLGDVEPSPSLRVFAFAAGIAGATILLAGFLPALRAAGIDPAEPIKEGGMTTSRLRDRYNPLIIGEVALSTGLLMTATLFALYGLRLESFQFDYFAKRLTVGSVRAGVLQSRTPGGSEAFFDDLLTRVRALPIAEAAATQSIDWPDHGLVIGEEGTAGVKMMILRQYNVVSPDYLRTLGIPIVRGRDFEAGDRGTPNGAVIVDEAAAKALWPDGTNPVGHLIKFGPQESAHPWMRVIGVARWTELKPRDAIYLPPEASIYVVRAHDDTRDRQVILRSRSDADRTVPVAIVMRRMLQGVAPWVGFPNVHDWLSDYNARRQTTTFMTSTFSVFGLFGLVLCAVGLYGVLAYTVSRRSRELAVRVALGAQPINIARSVLHDTAVMVLAGIGVGGLVALLKVQWLSESLFEVRYELVLALLVAEGLLVIVGVVAGAGPMMQAVRANPVDALRAN